MSEDIRRESPLVQFIAAERDVSQPTDAGVQLCERAFMGHINLRGDPSDKAFLKAVEGVVGIGLPLEPNTVADGPKATVLWLGPNEWLLLTQPDQQAGMAQALRDALGDLFAAATDLTGGQTVINLRGDHARDVLSKGCTLDLHPRVFGPGRCAQTHLAKAVVFIRQLDDSPSFDIIVRRSFADYLALWLKDAAQEYGLAVITWPTEGLGATVADSLEERP